MGENVDRGFKSDNEWFSDFTSQFNASVGNAVPVASAMNIARSFADSGRVQPYTAAMNHQIDTLRTINNWDYGAALRVKANLFHAELQYDFSDLFFNNKSTSHLILGLDYRDYIIVPDGNYFI